MDSPERMSQSEKALQGLRALILAGEFAGTDRLPEVALSERLGISRTPLRQAMDRLVAEGLLEKIETGGCRVARFTTADIIDSIELRGVIEGTAARMAAERGVDPALMAQMAAVLDRLDIATWGDRAVDFDRYGHENSNFHDLLARMAGSPVIERELERVSRLPLASPSAFLLGQDILPDFQASLRRAQRQHRHIYDSIQNREGSRAESLCREHARIARENLEYLTSGDPRQVPKLARRVPGLLLVAS